MGSDSAVILIVRLVRRYSFVEIHSLATSSGGEIASGWRYRRMMDKPSARRKFAEIFLTVGRHALQQLFA